MISSTFLEESPLYENLHGWSQKQISTYATQQNWKCYFCKKIIATQKYNYHFSGTVCSVIRVELDPVERPLIKLIFQHLKKRYSSSRKDYWMSSQEQSWLELQSIVAYCKEGRLKHWLFKKFDGEYQWIANNSFYASKLGQTIVRYNNLHLVDLLELDYPTLNHQILTQIKSKRNILQVVTFYIFL